MPMRFAGKIASAIAAFAAVILFTGAAVAQRRPALVTLRTPCLIEYLNANEPAARQDEGARTQRIRQRMLSNEGDQYRASLRAAKAPFVETMRQRGITVNSQTETVLNAITIEATDDDLAWLRAQPGVASAEYAMEMRAALDAATKLTGAAQVWTQLGGASQTGRGIKVAMVDSGIDITNPMFNDSGFSAPAGFPKGDDATAIANYTNDKVIVAKNFVICSQDSSCNPTFDNTPADGYGHGSHTASIVGGNCVTSPANTTICGTAPGVFLGNYKVFDTTNSYSTSNWVLNAMDAAVLDGMDVINFSGGSSHTAGFTPTTAQLYTPIHNAVAAGVPVAVCAGNCGPNGAPSECVSFGDSSMWAPAVSPDAISVGASTNSHVFAMLGKLQVSSPVSLAINANPGSSPVLQTAIGPATLASVSGIDSTKLLCSPAPAGSLAGKIALVMRGTCAFTTKVNDAAAGGAIAVVIYDSSVESLAFFGLSTSGAQIASAGITQSDGQNLESLIASSGSVQVQLFPAAPSFAPQTADLVSSYSSRGPNLDYTVKPDVLAPGDVYAATQTLNSAAGTVFDPSHFNYGDGTSYATPQVAGAAAILKQQRPALTAHDIKSALVNTAAAITATQDGSPAGVMQTGAGRLNIPAALATTLTSDPVSISFGLLTSLGSTASASVTLKGVGTQSETFKLSVAPVVSDPRVSVTPGSSTITVSPGQTVSVLVNFSAPAGVTGVYEGFVIVASQTGSTSLRIPYWALLGAPSVPAGSLVDGAAFAGSVAPGGIASLFGSNLGGDPALASALPLTTNLAHSQVFIVQTLSGTTTTNPMPIFYTSGGQVNFQMPYALSATANARVYAVVDGVNTAPLTFTPATVAPQVFTTTSGSTTIGVVVHGVGGGLITASSPAAAGEVVTIYATGLGAVIPAVATGAGAPLSPLANTAGVTTATIGSKTTTASFSGLAPGFVGLYQVNAVVPSGLSSGSQSLTISVSGVASKSVTTFVQ